MIIKGVCMHGKKASVELCDIRKGTAALYHLPLVDEQELGVGWAVVHFFSLDLYCAVFLSRLQPYIILLVID